MISRRRHLSLTLFICSFLSACASPKPLEMGGYMPAETLARAKDGDGVTMTELQDAASGGNGAAEYALGLSLAEGWTGKKDLEQAFVWWQRAAEHGSPEAKNALAVAYAEGLNGPPNLALARGLWQQAAEQGNATAQYNLASLLVATAETAADMAVAADWLRRSAEQGDPDAQYFLGNLYYNGEGVPRQQQESIRLWREAAAQGHVESEFSLAEAYLMGAAVPVDVAEAEKWMHKAARHGHPDAAKPAAMLARGAIPQPRIVERRSGGLPARTLDIDDQFEPSVPKFKAPVAVRSEVAAVETERAKTKLQNAAQERRVPSVAEKKMAKAAGKGRSASAIQRVAGRAATKVAARSSAPVAKLARAAPAKPSAMARMHCLPKGSPPTTRAETKQAAAPPRAFNQAKPPASTKVPMPVRRQVAQAASPKTKAR
jgi:TPR repeat protein